MNGYAKKRSVMNVEVSRPTEIINHFENSGIGFAVHSPLFASFFFNAQPILAVF